MATQRVPFRSSQMAFTWSWLRLARSWGLWRQAVNCCDARSKRFSPPLDPTHRTPSRSSKTVLTKSSYRLCGSLGSWWYVVKRPFGGQAAKARGGGHPEHTLAIFNGNYPLFNPAGLSVCSDRRRNVLFAMNRSGPPPPVPTQECRAIFPNDRNVVIREAVRIARIVLVGIEPAGFRSRHCRRGAYANVPLAVTCTARMLLCTSPCGLLAHETLVKDGLGFRRLTPL